MPNDVKPDDPDHGRPIVSDVGGKMGESKGVWRILLNSTVLAVVALAVVGLSYAYLF